MTDEIYICIFSIKFGNFQFQKPTQKSPFKFPEYLQFLRTKTVSLHECKRSIVEGNKSGEMISRLGMNNICTINQENEGLWTGDIGNALVSEDGTLFAVSSWASDCGKNIPDVYTKTYPYLEWIQNEMETILKVDIVEHSEQPKSASSIFHTIRNKVFNLF